MTELNSMFSLLVSLYQLCNESVKYDVGLCVWQIAHMSRTEMTMLDTTFIGPGLLFLNQYFDTFFNELVVLWICFVS